MADLEGKKIAFVQASWHDEIVDQARVGFLSEIAKLGLNESDVQIFKVPGVFELPLHISRLIKTGKYAAAVGAGFVVNGGIYHHEFVSSAVIDGLMRVQLDLDTPVFSVALTPHNFQDTEEHSRFFIDHFVTKGAEAARACVATLNSLAAIASDS